MDAYQSFIMGNSYFQSCDYSEVYGQIRTMLLYCTNFQLAGLNIQHYTKLFYGMVRYAIVGNVIVPCHRILAVLDVPYHFIITAFPALYLSNLMY